MSIEPFKKTKLQKRILFWCSILALIAVVIVVVINPDKKKCQEMNKILAQATDSQLNGVVLEKKLNPNLDSIVTFERLTTSIQNIEIYNMIKNGDSIVSEANSPLLKICRSNDIIEIDLREIYSCDYSYYHFISKRWVNP
ncbi:MAG: hypothetical protein ACOH1O_05355 [Flavobacterium sp.]